MLGGWVREDGGSLMDLDEALAHLERMSALIDQYQNLYIASTRAAESLASLINYCDDPGTEAMGALYCLRQELGKRI